MDMSAFISEVKLKLSGNLLDLELSNDTFKEIINSAFREIQRFIDTTRLATIPYDKSCIDLSECGVSSVSRVFRAAGYLNEGGDKTLPADPLYLAQWNAFTGSGGMYNVSDWTYKYASWNTALQMRNTASTDLAFRFDRHTNQLYINIAFDKPEYITIEYVPRYNDVSEIVSDYWIDVLIRLAVAITKTTLGRVRSRYTQTNALWAQDGETLLAEGNEELTSIREQLRINANLCYPVD